MTCPVAIAKFNQFMGGVDRNDQTRQYYHVRLKGRKYYKYIFWFAFEVSIANAYVLYTRYGISTDRDPGIKNIMDFRLKLAKELIGDYNSRKRPGPKTNAVSKKTAHPSLPVEVEETNKEGSESMLVLCQEEASTTQKGDSVVLQ